MSALEEDIRRLKGVGERRAALMNRLGIFTLRDLISYFPRDYEDRSELRSIAGLAEGESACVEAMPAAPVRISRIRAGLELARVRVVDGSGALDLTFFNQSYVRDALIPGETYRFFGRVEIAHSRRAMTNPVFERADAAPFFTGRIVPVYRLTTGLTSGAIARTAALALEKCADELPDPLPDAIREEHHLAHARFAYENIHFPASREALELARRRLIFEELFLLTLGLRTSRAHRERQVGLRLRPVNMEEFYRLLPFSLTGAQRRAVDDAIGDMTSGLPMSRLIQGDVGSGKTMAAAACVYFAARNGLQSALLVPTEILAEQHFRTLTPLLGAGGLRIELLTGALKAAQRRETLYRIASGEADLVIGTHALLSSDVEFARLGLVITDEQHRFGVGQRAAIAAKGERPHVLVMSATPIPRTLALIIYGDLDISVIDELPPGRKSVRTFVVGNNMRPRIEAFIRRLVGEGRQVFIVCPLVENEDGGPPDDRKSVLQYAEALQTGVFPELRVSFVHGKMKDKEKNEAMARFAAGETDILVSTTVIEVGVDVPNAALMLVENAERFGLSQLHQLRGRVGRGAHQSYCVLFSDAQNGITRQRLSVMQRTNDGFQIAEEDLKLRGPGDFFGSRQHGLPQLKIADFATDVALLREAQETAQRLLDRDGELSLPEHRLLREHIRLLFRETADTFN